MRIKDKRKIRFVALLVCLSLITLVSTDIVSRHLFVDLTVSDAEYSIEWVSVAPSTLSVLETYYGELKFSTTLDPSSSHPFDLVLTIEIMPAGASFSDVRFGIQLNAEPTVVSDWLTGMTTTISRVIGVGSSFIDHDIELYVGYPGVWQFSLAMDVP